MVIRNCKKGIMTDNASYNVFSRVSVSHINEEGIHFRRSSQRNTLQFSTVSHTGLTAPGIGEGVYIGE